MDLLTRRLSLLPRFRTRWHRLLALLVVAVWTSNAIAVMLATVLYEGVRELRAWRATRASAIEAGQLDRVATARAAALAARAGQPAVPVLLLDDVETNIALFGPGRRAALIVVDAGARQVLHGPGLDALLSHEFGHLAHRDPARELLQRAGVACAVVAASLLPVVVVGPIGLPVAAILLAAGGWAEERLVLGLLREAERSADRFSVELVGPASLALGLRLLHHRDRALHGLAAAIAAAHGYGISDGDPVLATAVDLLLAPSSATGSLRRATEAIRAALPATTPSSDAQTDLWDRGIHDPLAERLARIGAV